MKPFITLLAFLLAFTFAVRAQETFPEPKDHPKRAYIELANGDTARGYIWSQNDSTLLYGRKASFLKEMQSASPQVHVLSYKDISAVHVHRKGGVWIGMGIGAVSGALIGTFMGAMTYQEPAQSTSDPNSWSSISFWSKGDNMALGGIFGTFSGILIGAVVGAFVHHKFTIDGKKERFQQMRKRARIIP